MASIASDAMRTRAPGAKIDALPVGRAAKEAMPYQSWISGHSAHLASIAPAPLSDVVQGDHE
jgi:hypothetical protein